MLLEGPLPCILEALCSGPAFRGLGSAPRQEPEPLPTAAGHSRASEARPLVLAALCLVPTQCQGAAAALGL